MEWKNFEDRMEIRTTISARLILSDKITLADYFVRRRPTNGPMM